MTARDLGGPRHTMRAGREPTEDVKRAFRRAIKFAGLDVHKIQMMKSDESVGRVVFGWAKPE